jgi:hypothetical protein
MENNNTKSVIVTKVYTKEGNPIIFDERPEGDEKDIREEYNIKYSNEVLQLGVTEDEITDLLARISGTKGISVTPATSTEFDTITCHTAFVGDTEEKMIGAKGYIITDQSNPDMVTWVPEEDIDDHLTKISIPATQVRSILVKEMTRGNYNMYRGWIIPENEDPSDEGFLVKDPENNHITWIPKDVFEKTITIDSALINTAVLMRSCDFKDRFKAEYDQLSIRYYGLQKMVNAYENNQLKFTPKCSLEILKSQLDVMKKYIEILEERAKIENILL